MLAAVRSLLLPCSASLGLLVGGLLALPAFTPRKVSADVPTISADSVKPGMKGYGLTVFEGTEPTKFDVEVIGVLHKFRPNQDLLLVKTIHPRLEKVKVVAGMSGSPIFLNDGPTSKLAGAYAYGWSFGNEPVAGVTPIETMQKEFGRPLSPALLPKAGKAPIGPAPKVTPKKASLDTEDPQKTAWNGDPGGYSIESHVKQVSGRLRPMASSINTPQMVDTPLMIGGMSEQAVKELATLLQPMGLVPLQAGGAGATTPSKDAPLHYVDGGAIAVQLMRGDAAAQATGTVTHVVGKKLLGFGHPMMEVGATHMPTAIAKILWVLSSDQRSFKIGEPVRPLGTLIQDRESTIVVDEDIVAPTIPMKIDLHGDPTNPKKVWNMEIVHDRFMTPMWASFAFGDAVGVTLNDRRDASWTLKAQIKLKGKGTLKFDDFGVGPAGVPGGMAFFMSRAGLALGELMNNPWETVEIERVDAQLDVDFARNTVRLRGAELLDNSVEPGGTARVKLTLKPYQGKESTVIASIKVLPVFPANKEVEIEVVPGWMVMPDAAAPENLDQLIANLQLPELSPKAFVLQYKHPEQGVALAGKVAPKLPTFAIDALKPTTGTVQPEGVVSYVRSTTDVGGYAEGTSKVRVMVKPASK